MKLFSLTLLTVLLLFLCGEVSASHYLFENANRRQVEEMRLELDVAGLKLEKILETKLPDTITIVLVSNQAEFDSVAHGRLPDWGAGVAIPARNLIALREPMIDTYPGSMADLLQHELAHIALHHRVGAAHIPRFIDEGFATWFAGQWTFSNITAVAAAQITGSLLSLREIDQITTFKHSKANLAYSQSYLFMLYFFDRFGELAFVDLLDAIKEGKGIDAAFHKAAGIPFWRFEQDYRKFLADNYTLVNILSGTMGFWVVLAIIVIFGFIVVKKRRKDALQRWKEEEKYESTDLDWNGSSDDDWRGNQH